MIDWGEPERYVALSVCTGTSPELGHKRLLPMGKEKGKRERKRRRKGRGNGRESKEKAKRRENLKRDFSFVLQSKVFSKVKEGIKGR